MYLFVLNNKLLLGSIITTVVLFVIGVALSFYEVINTTYVDGVPSRYKKIVKEKQVTYTDDLNLTCDSFPHTNCTYEIDDSLNDNVVATVSYYDFNKSYEITDDLKYKHKENEEFSLKEFYDIFINDLKQNYEDKNILIVTHSGIVRVLYYYFNGIPEDGNLLGYQSVNASLEEYEI